MNPGLDKVLTWQAGTTYWSFRPRRTPRKHPGQGAAATAKGSRPAASRWENNRGTGYTYIHGDEK